MDDETFIFCLEGVPDVYHYNYWGGENLEKFALEHNIASIYKPDTIEGLEKLRCFFLWRS
jgi:hypothetical protein